MKVLQLWIIRTGPLHTVQQFTDDIDGGGMGQFRALDLGWVETELVSPPALPHLHSRVSSPALLWVGHHAGRCWDWLTCTHASRVSSTVLPSQGSGPTLLSTAAYEGLGQPSGSHNLRAGSLVPPPSGPALLCCPGEIQGWLSSGTAIERRGLAYTLPKP